MSTPKTFVLWEITNHPEKFAKLDFEVAEVFRRPGIRMYANSRGHLVFTFNGIRYRVARYVLGQYKSTSGQYMSDKQIRKIKFLNGDKYDCRKENLGGNVVMRNEKVKTKPDYKYERRIRNIRNTRNILDIKYESFGN